MLETTNNLVFKMTCLVSMGSGPTDCPTGTRRQIGSQTGQPVSVNIRVVDTEDMQVVDSIAVKSDILRNSFTNLTVSLSLLAWCLYS